VSLQLNRLRLDQVERALAPHQALSGKPMPSGGWLRAVREAFEAQAERRARQEVLGVAHSMSLEAQRPSDPFVEQQVAQRREDLLAGSWSRLWQ
jgi:hypothetical protein